MTGILDLVGDGALITGGVQVLTTFVKNVSGRDLSDVAKKLITLVVCIGVTAYTAYTSGQYTNLDLHDTGKLIGVFGVLLVSSSQLYDKVLHPVKTALKGAAPK